ncbi:MFS transporter [Humibacter sp. BT305]|nr:MFS transporter [Humibacter sp. BT305]
MVGFMIGAFALGTSESVVAGILPQISAGTGVAVAGVGSLVLAYAATVTVLGPLVTVALSRWSTRRTLLALLVWYAAANVLAASAPTFEVLFVARVLAGLAHTTILVRFSLTAIHLARPGREASSMGMVLVGLTAASVLGVPAGIVLTDLASWRAPFLLIAALALLALVVVMLRLPALPAPARSRLRGELGWMRRPGVLVGIGMSVLCAGASMLVMTYVAPLLTGFSGLDPALLPAVLLLYGVGGVVGNLLGARLADRDLARALTWSSAALAVTLAALWSVAALPWAAVAVLAAGVAYFATITPISALVARESAGPASDVALAINSSAFNLGIAGAAGVGGLLLGAGAPASALPAAALLPALAALGLALLYRRLSPTRERSLSAASTSPRRAK